MNTFRPIPEISEDIEITKDDDGVNVHFGTTDTVGFNFTEDGVSITPDWTNRRFTLALLPNSAFFHVTEEGKDEWKREEARHISHEGLIAEFYDSLRNIGGITDGNLRPITMFGIDRLYRWDLDELKDFFEERRVIEHDDGDARINSDKLDEIVTKIETSLIFRIMLFRRIMESVSVEEAKKNDGWLYVSPRLECFILVYPDGYACKLMLGDIMNALSVVASSRWGDAMLQATEFSFE